MTVQNVTLSNASCANACDGTALVTVSGGTSPYTYVWSDAQTTPTASGLCAGVYSVTVTDANGCDLTESNIIISEPSVLANSGTTVTDATCNGSNDGTASVMPIGGTSPYTYLWSDGQTTPIATGLVAGTYSVTVTDANNCSIDVNNINVAEPAPLTLVNTVITNATCFGSCDGTITVNVTGGTGPYNYTWTMNIIDQLTGNGTPSVSDLCKGTYSVTVTDANGCTLTIDNIIITEPSPIFNNGTLITDVSCQGANDGSISLDIFLAYSLEKNQIN